MPAAVESLNIKIDQLIESDRKKTKQIEALQTQVKKQYKQIKKLIGNVNVEVNFSKKPKNVRLLQMPELHVPKLRQQKIIQILKMKNQIVVQVNIQEMIIVVYQAVLVTRVAKLTVIT